MPIKIVDSRCIGCAMCVMFCPECALAVTGETFLCSIDYDLCNSCLVCLDCCPTQAIEEA